MTTDAGVRRFDVRGTAVRVVRKPIRRLHLGVYPPDGRVRVAAPLHVDDETVRLAVVMRLGWIRRRQAEFERQVRQSRRELVTGESHYVDGRRRRLDVVERDGPREAHLTGNSTLTLRVRSGDGRDARDAVLSAGIASGSAGGCRRCGRSGSRGSASPRPTYASGG